MIKYETKPEGFFPFIFCADCKMPIENIVWGSRVRDTSFDSSRVF